MSKRTEQKEETRARIVEAAITGFSERGFHGTSTRQIAALAQVNQGLITYHFQSKEALWKAVMDRMFTLLEETIQRSLGALGDAKPKARAREGVRAFVRFAAAHPEFFRLMIDEGKVDDQRLRWLIDAHLSRAYQEFLALGAFFGPKVPQELGPHMYYALAGAGSLFFIVGPECERLTGVDPRSEEAIERHAELVARLLVP